MSSDRGSSASIPDSECDLLEASPPPAGPFARVIGGRRTLFATPYGDPRTIIVDDKNGKFMGVPPSGAFPNEMHARVETATLEQAIAAARAGDIVQLLPEKSWQPLPINRRCMR